MKKTLSVVRWIVGVLFIFSGLTKVDDPVGTAIKMKEYFEVFSHDIASFFQVFEPHALTISVILNVLEVSLGVAILARWKVRLTSWVLLLLTLFFTFLTFYTAYFNKVTDCGCFGDAITLTPWESFGKDVVLLMLVGLIFVFRNKIPESTYGPKHTLITSTIGITTLLCLYAIMHLPFIDFRPYKVGTNIPEAMKAQEAAHFQYTFKKDGKEIKSEKYLSEKDGYKFVGQELLNPETSTPKITDFTVWNESGDHTEEMLQGTKLWIISYNVNEASLEGLKEVASLTQRMNRQEIQPVLLTSSSTKEIISIRAKTDLVVPYFYGDGTVLKTIIRANPGLVLVKDGVVLGKWHYNDTPTPAELHELTQP